MSVARVHTITSATSDNGYERGERPPGIDPKTNKRFRPLRGAPRPGMRKCGKCGDELPKGSTYLTFAVGFRGHDQVRCTKKSCYPKPSERESSLVSSILSAQEDADENIAALEWAGDAQDIIDALYAERDMVAEAIDEVRQQYEDADEAMGGHQGSNYERAQTLESSKDEVEQWSPDDDEPDGCGHSAGEVNETCDDCSDLTDGDACELHDKEHDTPQDGCQECTDKASEWVFEQGNSLSEAINGVDLG